MLNAADAPIGSLSCLTGQCSCDLPWVLVPILDPGEQLKLAYDFLRSRTSISRDDFAEEFQAGGLSRIDELIKAIPKTQSIPVL
jgi:hypothetical protein